MEFLYFDRNKKEMSNNLRYDPRHDLSVLKTTDTRKTRLTLRMINDMRKASESREREQEEELVLVKKMYGAPPAGSPGL